MDLWERGGKILDDSVNQMVLTRLERLHFLGHGRDAMITGEVQTLFRADFDAVAAGDAAQTVDMPLLIRLIDIQRLSRAAFIAQGTEDAVSNFDIETTP